jgi:heme exporter protein A
VDQPPAIELRGVVRRFGERTVLREVSVSVPAGATLAVLGRNGAGKSTLLRILATLLRVHAGEVRVLGEELPRRAFAVRGRLGLLGHDPLLYRDLSGRENLGYHARLYGVALHRVEEVLDAVGMRERADEPVRLLSRGMVQRLAVCRVVLHRPSLLLLDEPLAGMSPRERVEMVKLLKSISEGRTMIIIDHDMDSLFELVDRVTVLQEGRLLAEGTTAEIKNNKAVQEAYLGGVHAL